MGDSEVLVPPRLVRATPLGLDERRGPGATDRGRAPARLPCCSGSRQPVVVQSWAGAIGVAHGQSVSSTWSSAACGLAINIYVLKTFAFTGGRTASRPGRRAAVTAPARHLLPLAGMGAIVVEQAPWLHMVTM